MPLRSVRAFADRELGARRRGAIATVERYNAIGALDFAEQECFVAEELFGSAGIGASVQQGFNCDNGRNIHVGDHLIINYGCTILDVAEVTIGDWVMVGPHVLISTVNHPLSPRGRRNRLGVAAPVHIGDDVWVGGHATILPGVTIGDGAVVAAGAVVTKDVPPYTVVAGVPARVIKQIENDLDGWVEGERHRARRRRCRYAVRLDAQSLRCIPKAGPKRRVPQLKELGHAGNQVRMCPADASGYLACGLRPGSIAGRTYAMSGAMRAGRTPRP